MNNDVGGYRGVACTVHGESHIVLGLLVLSSSYISEFCPYFFDISAKYLHYLVYIVVGFMAFEGITGIILTNHIGQIFVKNTIVNSTSNKIKVKKGIISTERALRIVISVFLFLSVFFEPYLWFLKWYIGVMFIFSGLSNICIMSMFLNYLGLSYDE
jgi:hypothetical protein